MKISNILKALIISTVVFIPLNSFAEPVSVRQVEPFNKIDVDGEFNVKITDSEDQKVEIIGNQNITPNVLVNVLSQTLFIRLTSDTPIPDKKLINVNVSLPHFDSLRVSGTASVIINNLNNDVFDLKLSNTTNTSISGKTRKFNLYASGKSKINMDKFIIQGKGSSLLIDLSSSANFEFNKINTKFIKANIRDSSYLSISGVVQDFEFNATGSSILKAKNLITDKAVINMTDCTEADVYVNSKLKVILNSFSILNYFGKPVIEKTISKSAKLNKFND